MESKKYWRGLGDRFAAWEDKQLSDRKRIISGQAYAGSGLGNGGDGGKRKALEAYLSVPTFLRRGIRLALPKSSD